ncbi:putative RIP metalloprotease RseP [Leptospira fainei serovar Hurstbridge str. BUT 6]|uniref:RIP metalloprotease RseP n=1 Tax=Leptospira fainei serovar Hurstbridge str. BUT 6 TaxID=1193011 RepID=S3UX50_9LEPT|nr:site-2 protease family protein [Leptospira fainei]EPG74961.1 putative RIP metalloprotease RseP [Leptospira fainei serovar Hurstbridge str. BUT 6]
MLTLIFGAVFMLALCIFIHELGHLVMGWLVGVKARVFSIGYGKGIWKKQIGETTFQITGIPIGGYVLFKGDEYGSNVKGEKGEFLSTPPLKRMIPVIGGPLFNLILGFIIVLALYLYGHNPSGNRIYLEPAYNEYSPGYHAGLRSGDKILAVNGIPTETKYELISELGLSKGHEVALRVEREGGKPFEITVPDAYLGIEFAGERWVEAEFDLSDRLYHWLSSKLDKNKEAEQYQKERMERIAVGRDLPPEQLALQESKERQKILQARALDYLNDGDRILSVNGIEVHTVPQLQETLGKFQKEKVKLVIDRKKYPLLNPWSREKVEVEMPVLPAYVVEFKSLKDKKYPDLSPSSRNLLSYDPEVKLKLLNLKLNGKSFASFEDFLDEARGRIGQRVELQMGGDSWEATLGLRNIGLLGFRATMYVNEERMDRKLSLLEAFTQSGKDIVKMISDNLRGLGMLFSGLIKVKDSLSGPVGLFKASQYFMGNGILDYWEFVAKISIALMIMNLLPIPVADGGHIVFFAYEAVAGRPLPQRVMEGILRIGFFFLLGLGFYVSYYDFFR